MSLRLTLVASPGPSAEVETTKVFDKRGGRLGRKPDNDWVLPDPRKYVSSHHASIEFRDGRYYVVDMSLNGVLVNGRLLGQGNSTVLTDGDRIAIGEYELLVSTEIATAPLTVGLPESPVGLAPEGTLGFEPVLPELPEPSSGPFGPEPAGREPTLGPSEDLLGPSSWTPPPPPAAEVGPAQRDDLPAVNEPFRAPRAVSEIPDNWWEEATQPASPEAVAAHISAAELSRVPEAPPPPPAERLATPPPSRAPAPEIAAPGPGPTPASMAAGAALPAGGGGSAIAAFLRGAGLEPEAAATGNEAELLEAAGALYRELVRGTMELLTARASVKQEARLQMTTIRAVENNPLKFSVSVDDALERLIHPEPGKGYLEPRRAVREAMQDLRAHQLATLAGLEAAVKGIFHRFDPERLEQSFSERSSLASILSINRKAKCWDLFTIQFRQIAQEAEEDFNALFGREFARAYEEQVRRLRSAPEEKSG
jgi:type VI secretion system protein